MSVRVVSLLKVLLLSVGLFLAYVAFNEVKRYQDIKLNNIRMIVEGCLSTGGALLTIEQDTRLFGVGRKAKCEMVVPLTKAQKMSRS